MRRTDFYYELPDHLIAQAPLSERGASRLLVLEGDSGRHEDHGFDELPDLLAPGDLLVLNDTRVIPARLFGRKPSGGRVEVLVERIESRDEALAHLRASKTPKAGIEIEFEDGARAVVLDRDDDLFRLRFDRALMDLLDAQGHVPLPPYIRRTDTATDRSRYQTVFAARPGAVAAPTAGLHFDHSMLDRLRVRGVRQTHVTLHVGAGTFQPVRAEDIREHRMHPEFLDVGPSACDAIAQTRRTGGRVVAVGTTVVRSLETAWRAGAVRPYRGNSELFIYPGYSFRAVDAMITNFHLPESTLLMLVCAFAGTPAVLAAYRHAVTKCYRFFSYGDAMLIAGRGPAGRG
jgi:S-adenosylmethionine:tRNA ribosyltransferase-isomerase